MHTSELFIPPGRRLPLRRLPDPIVRPIFGTADRTYTFVFCPFSPLFSDHSSLVPLFFRYFFPFFFSVPGGFSLFSFSISAFFFLFVGFIWSVLFLFRTFFFLCRINSRYAFHSPTSAAKWRTIAVEIIRIDRIVEKLFRRIYIFSWMAVNRR